MCGHHMVSEASAPRFVFRSRANSAYASECVKMQFHVLGIPIDSGMGLSIRIDKLRVFINKTLSTQSLINQLLIKRVGLSISVDSR